MINNGKIFINNNNNKYINYILKLIIINNLNNNINMKNFKI